MIRVIGDGENRHVLERPTGETVGWIRGQAIGFRGFTNIPNAMRAAVTAARALEIALRREYPGRPERDIVPDRVGLAHDGAYEWFTEGARPLARLLRPRPGNRDLPHEPTYGIELVLPSYATEAIAVTTALAVERALRNEQAFHTRPARRARVGSGGDAA